MTATLNNQSIKSGTRRGEKRPIRKITDRGGLGLPQMWSNFVALSDNKEDRGRFLTEYMMSHGNGFSCQYELVTSGGYKDSTKACSTQRGEIASLSSNHEEADTRLILHPKEAIVNNFKRIIVFCTDVLLSLIHFLEEMR